MKALLILLVAAVSALALLIPGSASASRSTTRYYHLCDNPDNLCLRDPSDGGTGTHVVLSPESGSHSEGWNVRNVASFCNGTGVISLGCGLPSFIFNRYHGKRVYELKNEGSRKCLRFSASHAWRGQMGSCGIPSSLLIGSRQSSGWWYFPSLSASESAGQVQWMCGNASGGQPFTGSGCESLWGLFT